MARRRRTPTFALRVTVQVCAAVCLCCSFREPVIPCFYVEEFQVLAVVCAVDTIGATCAAAVACHFRNAVATLRADSRVPVV